jgi:glutamate 5-kinase
MTSPLEPYHTVVVKIGSSLLIDAATHRLHESWLASLVQDVAHLHQAGKRVVIVTSGATALGKRALGWGQRPLDLPQKQAAAATGQIALSVAYHQAFLLQAIETAQVLLTWQDTEDRRRHLNARNTLRVLLDQRVIPIINENDTVATEELRYGDNDRLSARVAQIVGADALVILSDVDGLYTAPPQKDPAAIHIPRVDAITPEIFALARGPSDNDSKGGMMTKLQAAHIATAAGCTTLICLGTLPAPLSRLAQGAKYTVFTPRDNPLSARLAWIAGHIHPSGSLHLDDGAARAIQDRKSLLPVGVTATEGDYEKGDVVRILHNQRCIGMGMVNYDASDVAVLLGKRSEDIEGLLGYTSGDTLIHCDDMVVLTKL